MTDTQIRYRPVVLTVLLVLIADQISKWSILGILRENGPIDVLPFFNLVLVYNKGVSFGLFNHMDMRFGLIGFALLMTVFLIIWLIKEENHRTRIALAAVIAGAIGNVIDRIFHGAVIDFLDFHAFGWHYPAFNIADSSIVLGIAYLLFDSLFLEHRKKENHAQMRDNDKEDDE